MYEMFLCQGDQKSTGGREDFAFSSDTFKPAESSGITTPHPMRGFSVGLIVSMGTIEISEIK